MPRTVRNAFGIPLEMHGGAGRAERWVSAVLGTGTRLLGQLVRGIRATVRSTERQLRAVAPDRWFLVGFVIILLAFFALLLVQPSSVGRGGR